MWHDLSVKSLNDANTPHQTIMIIIPSINLNSNNVSGGFTITPEEFLPCPCCGGELVYRDSKVRKSKNSVGEVKSFHLRRLRCKVQECRKLHTEIPDFIQPHKHYDSDTIQSVLDGNEDEVACTADDSTIRRWKTEFAESEADICQRLASIHAQETDGKVPISDTVRILDRIKIKIKRWLSFVMTLLINSGHKLCTQFAFCLPQSSDTVRSGIQKNLERSSKNDESIKDSS